MTQKLLVQEFLSTKTFGDLAREHGVNASFSKSGHLISLNYDQLAAVESDPLSQDCRGLVLASADGKSFNNLASIKGSKLNFDDICPGETVIVAFPMRRFFNNGQGAAAKFDLTAKNVKIYEKLDGTLCILSKDKFNNEWNISTRSVPCADINIDSSDLTFRALFEKALLDSHGMKFAELTALCNEDHTYCWELCTPYNRIVVQHEVCYIRLLAVRDNKTFNEINIEECDLVKAHGFKCPRVYELNTSLDNFFSWVSDQNPFEHEGVVFCDDKFNRVKHKSAAYVAYNRVHDLRLGTSDRNCIEIILLEKEDDIIPMLPKEIGNKLLELKDKLHKMLVTHDEFYKECYENAATVGNDLKLIKKQFASLLLTNNKIWAAPLFNRFDGKSNSTKDFIYLNKSYGSWSNSFLDNLISKLK